MKKTISLVVAVLVAIVSVSAQSVADGIKYINYGKEKSALEILQKAYNSNFKDPSTVYWYGQALLAQEPTDVKGAKSVYQKALQDGVNDPWIWVGMGHVELWENVGGDLNSAKQKFEQAITATTETKGKNKGKPSAAILAAIGRANADGSSKLGDANYGIEKLKQAGEIDLTNAEIFENIGILYQKLGGENGGEAVKAYTEATRRDPKYASSFWHIGMIYSSQNNKDLMDQYFGSAIAADAAYPRTYLSYFNYYQNKDINKAKEYLDKYIQYADKDCKTESYYADYLFKVGRYQESLDKAKAMESGECKTFYKLPVIYAFNYDRLGDSVQAKANLDKFFASAPADKIEPVHYELAATVYAKFPGQEEVTAGYLQKAIDADTLKANKMKYYKQGADMFGKVKKYADQVKWLQKYNELKGTLSEFDYYTITSAAYNAQDYALTMALAKDYIAAFPDKPNGYSINVKAAKALDTTTNPGASVDAMLLQNQYYAKDTAKNNKFIANNYYNIMLYYADRAKDYVKALEYCDKFLEIYPTNKEMLDIRNVLKTRAEKSKPVPGSGTPTPPTPPAKPATGGGSHK